MRHRILRSVYVSTGTLYLQQSRFVFILGLADNALCLLFVLFYLWVLRLYLVSQIYLLNLFYCIGVSCYFLNCVSLCSIHICKCSIRIGGVLKYTHRSFLYYSVYAYSRVYSRYKHSILVRYKHYCIHSMITFICM